MTESLNSLRYLASSWRDVPHEAIRRDSARMLALIDQVIADIQPGESQKPRRRNQKQSGKVCSCGQPVRAKGYCRRCYSLVWRGKEPVVCAHKPLEKHPGGRPKAKRRCPNHWCRQWMGTRELRRHLPHCRLKHFACQVFSALPFGLE